MAYQNLRLEVAAPLATLVLNRPERLNALNLETARELRSAVEAVAARADIRAVILRGEGRAFSAGGDIRGMQEWVEQKRPEGFFDEPLKEIHALVRALWELPKPVIAAVHGVAAGAGMSLALAADLRLAAEGTRFSLAFINIGLSPDSGSTYTLPRLVGLGKALELALTGEFIAAEEAAQLGLVNRVVPEAELVAAAEALARRIAEKSAYAVARIKRLLHDAYARPLAAQLDAEHRAQMDIARHSADFIEGVRAFLEKRP
ncbi:MAG: enoyl-CoA hydratase/isomerase family protein, partial [Terriglobia bacterium]